jgi:hypothetical protein
MMLSGTEMIVLEIGAGAWFITAAALILVFGYFVLERISHDRQWRESPTTTAAIALILFGLGSSMRAGLAWYRFASGDFDGAEFILTWWPLFEVSIGFNAAGAALAIYVLSPRWRACTAFSVVAAAFVIPSAIWLF